VAAVFDPYVKMVNALPRVVLARSLRCGSASASVEGRARRHAGVLHRFFNVYQGVKESAGRARQRPHARYERAAVDAHVYWPSALSWMFSSLHTSVGFAVVGAVVGEYLGSAAGLGYLIQQAEGIFDVAGVFAGMFRAVGFCHSDRFRGNAVERRLLVCGRMRLRAGVGFGSSPLPRERSARSAG